MIPAINAKMTEMFCAVEASTSPSNSLTYTEILYLIENQVKYYTDQVNQGNIYRGLAGRYLDPFPQITIAS